jgi:hypothetical protein
MYPAPSVPAVQSEPYRIGEVARDPAVERAEIEQSMAQSRAAFEAFRAAATGTTKR